MSMISDSKLSYFTNETNKFIIYSYNGGIENSRIPQFLSFCICFQKIAFDYFSNVFAYFLLFVSVFSQVCPFAYFTRYRENRVLNQGTVARLLTLKAQGGHKRLPLNCSVTRVLLDWIAGLLNPDCNPVWLIGLSIQFLHLNPYPNNHISYEETKNSCSILLQQ